jgi:hypothetical protein
MFIAPLRSNVLGADYREHRFQQLLGCFVLIRCRGKVCVLKSKLRGFSQQAYCTDRATADVGEVSVNFSGQRVPRGQRNEFPRGAGTGETVVIEYVYKNVLQRAGWALSRPFFCIYNFFLQ